MHTRRIVILLLYLATILFNSVLLHAKTQDLHSFKQMIRYGRAGKSDNAGSINVRPRADAFYLGPRYGKRSQMVTTHRDDSKEVLYMCNNDKNFSCSYTGVTNLYRCSSLRDSLLRDNSI
ncbi:RYamide neuropeptides-like [Sitophilus oryzae]|uniref:RYamide neuropeptides-like n=1 Tax=Sitophilus oryzae TaxID=7048 RepID=A0A6J2YU11_SITOR|nr:RYamide neuropeptides-like [Sitophilus oryzae]XP_030766792.1 RYamide neuropeptides-like [Sitophilus oryzae]